MQQQFKFSATLALGRPEPEIGGLRDQADAGPHGRDSSVRRRHEEAMPRKATKGIHVGSRVRIADGVILHAALRSPAGLRPEPGQMLWTGRNAIVTGYRRSPDGRSLYALKDAPGLWLEEWIDPI